MKYTNPPVPSSYRMNDLGETLYNIVLNLKPKRIVEFGTLHGYSAIAMGMALHELGEGEVVTHDIFNAYAFKHGSKENIIEAIKDLGLEKFVRVEEGDFNGWDGKDFDLAHIDISNTGETLRKLKQKVAGSDGVVLFEGGSKQRDQVQWMTKYNKQPMQSCGIMYEVVDDRFPSLSILGGLNGRDIRGPREDSDISTPSGENKGRGARGSKKNSG